MKLREHQTLSSADCHCPTAPGDHGTFSAPAGLEGRYQAAQARLLAAQQEKLEATVEFLAVRAAVRCHLERVWPGEGAWSDAEMAAGV